VWVEDDDETAAAFALADNRTAELGGYDEQALADLFGSVGDPALLAASGWDEESVAELLASASVEVVPDGLNDPDEVPEPPAEPITKLGDVWLLGEHRLVCGDSTDVGVSDVLLAGAKADLVWTDPPYGVGIASRIGAKGRSSSQARSEGGHGIQNDDLDVDALTDFLRQALGAALAACSPGAAWYVAAPHGPIGLAFSRTLHELGVWRHSLVWVKNSLVLGRADYHYRHEPIYYGWVPGAAHTWESDRKQDTILEFDRPVRSKEHPTMKPVELIEYCIGNSSKRGAVLLDPFGGSGSTLIAAHRTGRVARLVELDPGYCDVICRRYQEHTGDKPLLESTGEPHDFTADR